jgi:glycosyltransferase involved in cell wall biosynthesis
VKLACVVHRFGADIAGGSEAHCRGLAERLAAAHDVTVLTTCARDHISWANEYPPGPSTLGRLKVLRFPVARRRSMTRFTEISEAVFAGDASGEQQEQWFRENGPDAPELVEHLRTEGRAYDRILFWSFRYATTYFGMPPVADRALVLPTAEEDPAIQLDVLGRWFGLPAGFLFLTPEEETLVTRRASRPLPPSIVIGTGLEPPPVNHAGPNGHLRSRGIAQPFALYLGRIDPNKGCETLVRFFLDARASGATRAPLVMAGPAIMPLPDDPGLVPLGFVDGGTREALLSEASVLIMPSPYESLSMVLLEAWNHGRPALVNGRCDVLKGQALRSGGALYYRSYDEFREGLRRLLGDPELSRSLGQSGRAYVDREYRWPHVMGKLDRFLRGCR